MPDTFHIHIAGIVQGVGFRPFVHSLAKGLSLTGYVSNTPDGVHVEFNADKSTADIFYNRLIQEAPEHSHISAHSIKTVAPKKYYSFDIIASESNGEPVLMLTPDFAMCSDCKKELYSKSDPRYQYAFITCTHCGPRYSIVGSLPYDRHQTTMNAFKMCSACNKEYNEIENRRYYAQTNSCGDCGITLRMFANEGEMDVDSVSMVQEICKALSEGKILAIKGIGGYLLICDAANPSAIKRLRQRKYRPSKPFALMFPNVEAIEDVAFISETEIIALQSAVAPIILLTAKDNIAHFLSTEEVAPGLSRIGVMLPYTPLFDLILSNFNKPIVATSANLSDSPIIYRDDDALQLLFSVSDLIVTNNREILIPQDDSVLQFTPQTNQKIIIRRSRGLAPSFVSYTCKSPETILATGALLKSSFTFVNKKNIYISQYLGNTEGLDAQQSYSGTVNHFFELFHQKPEVILTDKHPQYFSNQFAKELAVELNVEVKEIQHHKAHFASVMAENNLLQEKEPVLGVVWDGTGLGDDQNIWGGEFFVYLNNHIRRAAHFDYFPFLLNDKMPREPRISALSVCRRIPDANELLEPKFTANEWNLYEKLAGQSQLKCSSVGRIFDAVASLLNLCDKQSYEGEAAMLLQERALAYFNKNGWKVPENYPKTTDISLLIENIVFDILRHRSADFIAAKLHYTFVRTIKSIADKLSIRKIAFSGGVFQNSVLVDLLQLNLANDFELYFHKELSPNDENISFGQFVYWDNNIDGIRANAFDKAERHEQFFTINTY